MKQQQLIFTITHNEDDTHQVNISFEPRLAGSEAYKNLTDIEQYLQNTVSNIASKVFKALEREEEESEHGKT